MTEQPTRPGFVSPNDLMTGCKEVTGIVGVPDTQPQQALLMNAVACNVDVATLSACRIMVALFPDEFNLLTEQDVEDIVAHQDRHRQVRS